MLSLTISVSQLWCHRIAHIATAALGIFISFALLLLLLCFILRHPLLGVGSSLCLEPCTSGHVCRGINRGNPIYLMPDLSNKLCCCRLRKEIQAAARSSGLAAMWAPCRQEVFGFGG